jgi:hypothetical protein
MAEQKKLKVKMKPGVSKATPIKTASSGSKDVAIRRASDVAKTASGSGGNKPPIKTSATASSGSKDVAIRRASDVAIRRASDVATRGSNARTMKDVSEVASKTGRAASLGRLATGAGLLAYSKDAGKGSDFKGTNERPAPYSGLNNEPKPAPKVEPVKAVAPRAVSRKAVDTGKTDRLAAYNEWVKSNRDPMSQLAKDRGVLTEANTPSDSPVKMKNGGSVKSKIDGIAQRGKTRGRIC